MSDRLVVYKTQPQRILEIALILSLAIATGFGWTALVPGISASYAIVAALGLGVLLVPALGTTLALRLGAEQVTAAERSRRYLADYTPIALHRRPAYARRSSSARGSYRG